MEPTPPRNVLEPVESRRERAGRHGRRARLYIWAIAFIGLLVALVALVAANSSSVELDWVFGSANVSLVWVILVAAILGWLLGLATSIIFRRRTRHPRPARGGRA
jgi:uncharacterized integral membrane protein